MLLPLNAQSDWTNTMRTRFLLAVLAAVMFSGTLPVSAQVSSGSTNAAQQNAAPKSQESRTRGNNLRPQCRPPLSAAVDRRGNGRLLHREGSHRAVAGLCLFRGGARPASGDETDGARRGAADRSVNKPFELGQGLPCALVIVAFARLRSARKATTSEGGFHSRVSKLWRRWLHRQALIRVFVLPHRPALSP